MKRSKLFYKIRAAIHKPCHLCNGEKFISGQRCAFCGGSGKEYRYILLPGSSRSSKTTSLIQNFYSEAWNEESKRFSVWRDTKKDCKDTVGEDMLKSVFPTMPYYSPGAVVHNKTDFDFKFPSGSVIEVCGTDDFKKIHGYNGYAIWLNEPYRISKDTFDQLDMRAEAFVCIDLNPLENHWSDDLAKDPRTIVIHSTFKDNPYCPPEQKRKIQSYQPVSMCEIVELELLSESEARNYNCTENAKGFTDAQVKELVRCIENERKNTASKFNWSVYGLGLKAERPNRIFNWERIPDHVYHELNARKYYGTDWGVVDPWALGEAKYYDGALYVHELNYKSENELMGELSVSDIEAIRDNEGLVIWMFNKLGIDRKRTIICDNNRPLKIAALWENGFDYAEGAPKPPNSIIDGISLLSKLKVYYTESSKNIEAEQESYSRKVDRYGVVLEEPEDDNNHHIDWIRYIALYLQLNGIIKII